MWDLIVMPFMIGIGFLGLFAVLLTVYALYDVLVNQERMQGLEKLIWVAAIVSFNLFGVITYFIIVRSQGTLLLDPKGIHREDRRLSELERLKDLHDADVLTDEEFEQEKRKLLEQE